ncbi:hypothetical protein RRG08_006134 [Elysia crispata]|uniref:Uncharacterized protein n=1 Tax=Elysia crispata TaxID=231223 RepID=A0AAE1DFF5_9GAST|nr:hypothetical protein RRG08_006134 [Elysia crispata]
MQRRSLESHWQCAKDSNAKAKTVQPNKEGEFCYTKNVFLLLQTPTRLMAGSGAKQVYSCDLSRQFRKPCFLELCLHGHLDNSKGHNLGDHGRPLLHHHLAQRSILELLVKSYRKLSKH